MPRKGLRPRDRRPPPPADYRYKSVLVSRLINKLDHAGRKAQAERVMYDALEFVAEKTKENALDVFTRAIENIRPLLEVKARRVALKEKRLLYRLRRTRTAIAFWPVCRQCHERQALVVRFNYGGQQFCCCGTARGHDSHGFLSRADAADGEESGGAFIEVLPEPDFIAEGGENDDEGAVAGTGADDEFADAGTEHSLDDGGGEREAHGGSRPSARRIQARLSSSSAHSASNSLPATSPPPAGSER